MVYETPTAARMVTVNTSVDEIVAFVKLYFLSELLPGKAAVAIDGSTQLSKSGILDSLKVVKLVTFLEESYRIEIQPHEMAPRHFETLQAIAALVHSKLVMPAEPAPSIE
jgi:acyl carrier protein